MPNILYIAFQKAAVIFVLRSCKIYHGTPKNLIQLLKKKLCYIWCDELAFSYLAGYKPAQFAKVVENNHQHIEPINFKQISHEVQSATIKFTIQNGQ